MCINKNMTKMISELNFLSLETYVLEILFRNPCVRSLMFFDPLDDLRETLPGDTIYQDNDTSGAVGSTGHADFPEKHYDSSTVNQALPYESICTSDEKYGSEYIAHYVLLIV